MKKRKQQKDSDIVKGHLGSAAGIAAQAGLFGSDSGSEPEAPGSLPETEEEAVAAVEFEEEELLLDRDDSTEEVSFEEGESIDPVEEPETSEIDGENEPVEGFEAAAPSADETEESFLPGDSLGSEAAEEEPLEEEMSLGSELDDSELGEFESADIEELEFVEEERLDSILESILFASDRPVSLNQIKMVFKGTNIRSDKIRRALDRLAVELAGSRRGVTLEEVPGGYQLRTKVDNMQFLTRTLKARPFKLSGPALETLAIVAYKQPLIKAEVDEIRGVESGHLLRALMEKGLINFEGKSDLPGKPMQYGTTKKFLEIFGLRNLKELPTLSQIDELLPEGIDEAQAEKPTLSQITDSLSQEAASTYSEGEDELMKITEQLQVITTTTDFFEQEKVRQRQKRDEERASSIREALLVGEEVSTRDRNWLTRYDEALMAGQAAQFAQEEMVAAGEIAPAPAEPTPEQVAAFDQDQDLEGASFDEAPADDEELAVPFHDDEDDEAKL